MAFNYMQLSRFTLDVELTERAFMAALAYCAVVQAEATNTTGHAQRVTLARSISQQPDIWKPRIGYTVISRLGAASPPITDAVLDTAVAAAWNAMAGV